MFETCFLAKPRVSFRVLGVASPTLPGLCGPCLAWGTFFNNGVPIVIISIDGDSAARDTATSQAQQTEGPGESLHSPSADMGAAVETANLRRQLEKAVSSEVRAETSANQTAAVAKAERLCSTDRCAQGGYKASVLGPCSTPATPLV